MSNNNHLRITQATNLTRFANVPSFYCSQVAVIRIKLSRHNNAFRLGRLQAFQLYIAHLN